MYMPESGFMTVQVCAYMCPYILKRERAAYLIPFKLALALPAYLINSPALDCTTSRFTVPIVISTKRSLISYDGLS